MTATAEAVIAPDLALGDDLPVLHVHDGLSYEPYCGAPRNGHEGCRGSNSDYRGQEACLFCGRPVCDACRQIFERRRKAADRIKKECGE